MSGRRRAPGWRRALAAVLGLAALLVALAHPIAGAASDVWGNVGPAPQLGEGGLASRYPLSHYTLDSHFDAVEASLTGGVDVSGVPPMIAYFLASILWLATSFGANLLIALFSFAFDLDLVNGSQATGGAGALAPVSHAIHSIYSNVFGGLWLALAVALTGIWAMWKALVQRRYSETAGALGLSLIYVVAALFFVAQPGRTIGSVSQWTNQMSGAFLSISSHGGPSSARQAKEEVADELFGLLVFKPWTVLNFGGLEHCVLAGSGSEDSDPESVAVRPLSSDPSRDAALSRRLQAGTEITADGKVCINNANKYAPRFLRYSLNADEHEERDKEYDALDDGDASGLPDAERSGYRLGVADKPATDAMEEGGQYQRLLLALVLFLGSLGAVLLLGALSIGVILAQVLLLVLLAFAPVALVAAAIPGRGHDFFKGWLEKLAGFLLRKAAYSLILAILLAVNGALASATSQLGWLMSFGLQALFFWAVLLQRKTLAESLIGIATGPRAPGRDSTVRLLALYSGARAIGRPFLRDAGRPSRAASRGREQPPRRVVSAPARKPAEPSRSGAREQKPDTAAADVAQGKPGDRAARAPSAAEPDGGKARGAGGENAQPPKGGSPQEPRRHSPPRASGAERPRQTAKPPRATQPPPGKASADSEGRSSAESPGEREKARRRAKGSEPRREVDRDVPSSRSKRRPPKGGAR
jgi:TrbL/VirB6 plasmid conjugal transfer protein